MSISFFRTIILYITIIVAMRLMGKRQIGELSPSDLVVTIMVSELAAIPLQDVSVPLVSGIIPVITLVAVEILTSYLCLKSHRIRRAFNGRSAVIIRGGKLDRQKMHDLRMTTDEVMETLRQNNIASPADLRYGVIEPGGKLSYVLNADSQPVTAGMMNLPVQNTGLPIIVISDGKMIPHHISLLNLTPKDIEKRLKSARVASISEVFIMTLDDCGHQFIQRKEEGTP